LTNIMDACTELNPVYRRLVKLTIEGLQFVEQQIGQLEQEIASLLQRHQDAVERLAVVPGSEWIRRNRLSPKWVPRQRPSPQPTSSPRG